MSCSLDQIIGFGFSGIRPVYILTNTVDHRITFLCSLQYRCIACRSLRANVGSFRHVSTSRLLERSIPDQGFLVRRSKYRESSLEEDMDKDGRIRVRRKPSKRRRSRGLAKAVADYLKSNCYMYAPLLESPPPDSSPSPAACSPSSTGISRDLHGLCSEIRTHRSVSFHTETVCVPSDKGASIVQLQQRLISK
ncbi:hypothetical protein Cni_G00815 [Canna indica]|uniref:Uncharacterized protein n=1 Tax=Canna indica TaxID=4628 RepID=A0AAQ3Q069_9LILI|nr:hypothetical protein Cni_G00815 [Canna indica]